MTFNDEQWGDVKEKVFGKFPDAHEIIEESENEDDLGNKYLIKTETLEFTSDFGPIRIERHTRPKILEKKAHYHKGAGGAKVEYLFSEDEKTSKVDIYKKDEVTGEWVIFDIPADKLNF